MGGPAATITSDLLWPTRSAGPMPAGDHSDPLPSGYSDRQILSLDINRFHLAPGWNAATKNRRKRGRAMQSGRKPITRHRLVALRAGECAAARHRSAPSLSARPSAQRRLTRSPSVGPRSPRDGRPSTPRSGLFPFPPSPTRHLVQSSSPVETRASSATKPSR